MMGTEVLELPAAFYDTVAEVTHLPEDPAHVAFRAALLGEGPTAAGESPRRRYGRWSRCCPFCRSSALTHGEPPNELGFTCVACRGELRPPPRNPRDLPTHATTQCHPRWEDDRRLQDGSWDRYSRPGELVGEWGRSTDRQDGGPPPNPDGDEPEVMPPGVRAEAVLGRQDRQLDAEREAALAHVVGLREAAEALKGMLQRAHAAVFAPPAPAAEPPPPCAAAPELPAPVASGPAALGLPAPEREPDLVADVDAPLFKSAKDMARAARRQLSRAAAGDDGGEKPAKSHRETRWRPNHLAMGWRGIELGRLQALFLLVVNALRARGIDYLGSTEQVRTRARRATPFAGLHHALAVVYGVDEPGESSPIPRHAMAKFRLPRGVVFGQIACKPTRAAGGGRELAGLDYTDIEDAIAAARVGARSYLEEGEVRHDAGRPLTEAERELVRLVDAGDVHDRALTTTKQTRRGPRLEILRPAVEQLHPREALARVRHLDGAPRTENEARIALRAARRAIRLELGRRGLIPGFVVEPTEPPSPAPLGAGDRRRGPRRVA